MIKFSKILTLFVLFNLLFGCDEDRDCIIILEKTTFDSKYYFLFENEDIFSNNNNNNNLLEYSPDKYSSGEVNFETYQKFNVGDEYCNF